MDNENTVNRRVLLGYFVIACISAVLLAAFRIVLMLNCYDASAEMYRNGTSLPVVFRVITAIVCILLCTGYVFFKGKKADSVKFRNVSLATSFLGALCCFLLVAYFIINLYLLFTTGFSQYGVFTTSDSQANERSRLIFYSLHMILMIPTAWYFFRVSFAEKNVGNTFCVLSMITILWVTVLLVSKYLDISVSFNSPNKILSQLALISFMLYMVFETRMNMGIPRLQYYYPAAFLAIVLCTIYSLSNVCLKMFTTVSVESDTVFDVLMLAFAVYIGTRVASFLRKPKPLVFGPDL